MATRKWLLAMLTGLGVAASAGMALPVQAADSTLTICLLYTSPSPRD